MAAVSIMMKSASAPYSKQPLVPSIPRAYKIYLVIVD